MSFRFHPEAEKEFLDGIQYYEELEAGLGQDFSFEVYSVMHLHRDPEYWKSRM